MGWTGDQLFTAAWRTSIGLDRSTLHWPAALRD